MIKQRIDVLLIILLVSVIMLMVMNIGVFMRIHQLQTQLIGIFSSLNNSPNSTDLLSGVDAPDFNLVDTNGDSITLRSYTGKKVLLIFSSINCSACQRMYSTMIEFSELYPEISLIMISIGTEDENKDLSKNQGVHFRILNWEDSVFNAYRVIGTPQFFIIDEDMVIRNSGFASSLQDLENLVFLNSAD